MCFSSLSWSFSACRVTSKWRQNGVWEVVSRSHLAVGGDAGQQLPELRKINPWRRSDNRDGWNQSTSGPDTRTCRNTWRLRVLLCPSGMYHTPSHKHASHNFHNCPWRLPCEDSERERGGGSMWGSLYGTASHFTSGRVSRVHSITFYRPETHPRGPFSRLFFTPVRK